MTSAVMLVMMMMMLVMMLAMMVLMIGQLFLRRHCYHKTSGLRPVERGDGSGVW
jgi:hypothetical protein